MPPSARQLIAVKVTGSKRYPGGGDRGSDRLQMGAAVDDDEFKKAARRLGDTGVFTDIGYTFSFSSAGTKLECKSPMRRNLFRPALKISSGSPTQNCGGGSRNMSQLFDGELPLFGRLADEVSDVLQAMLVENAIPGHVDYLARRQRRMVPSNRSTIT